MTIVEERLEAMVEIVANQKAKINDLEKALRDERSVNKVLRKLLKGQLGSELIERVEY